MTDTTSQSAVKKTYRKLAPEAQKYLELPAGLYMTLSQYAKHIGTTRVTAYRRLTAGELRSPAGGAVRYFTIGRTTLLLLEER